MGPGLSLNSELLNSSTDSESFERKGKHISSTYHDPDELDFVFSEDSLYDLQNGLSFNGIYLPEEVVILILSYIPNNEILKLRLVCKNWYNLLKTHSLWSTKYSRIFGKVPKPLPWYIFYAMLSQKMLNRNILLNNCGSEKYKHWKITRNEGHKFKIETVPQGCDRFPVNEPDFENISGCFVASFGACQKVQTISFAGNLMKYILDKHKPHIYISEWVAGRFDCGGSYCLEVTLYSTVNDENNSDEDTSVASSGSGRILKNVMEQKKEFKYLANEATQWKKIDMLLKDYPDQVEGIRFTHSGVDNQFWAGHYGPKMTAGVVRVLFDSIEPVSLESKPNEIEPEKY